MNCYFHPEAQIELDEAVEFYEGQQPGLGLDFARETYQAITRIVEYPQAWSQITPTLRRCLLNRFPFAVIYRISASTIQIMAIANLHRRPGFWRKR